MPAFLFIDCFNNPSALLVTRATEGFLKQSLSSSPIAKLRVSDELPISFFCTKHMVGS